MRLRVNKVSDGPGPGEVLVEVETSTGREQVVIHNSTIEGDTIDIGYPIHQREDSTLIELPRESARGEWRLWVPEASVI